jgi:hypothetical protein
MLHFTNMTSAFKTKFEVGVQHIHNINEKLCHIRYSVNKHKYVILENTYEILIINRDVDNTELRNEAYCFNITTATPII